MSEESLDSVFDVWLDKVLKGEAQAQDLEDMPDSLGLEKLKPLQALAHALSVDNHTLDTPLESILFERSLPFEELGGFRLVRSLGVGGMGAVYLAEQTSLNRLVALKILRHSFADKEEGLERLEKEARAVAQVQHPHIVGILEVGQHRDIPYLVMEYVPGRHLGEVLAEETVSPARITAWGRDIARALAAANQRGLIHRDVKPSNIRIRPDDRAVLLDFGLAKSLHRADATETQHFKGTPFYASPEQIQVGSQTPADGEKRTLSAATDIYSLGVTLYEAYAGVHPYSTSSTSQNLERILGGESKPLGAFDSDLPLEIELIVGRAMEPRPENRYRTMERLADDLDAVLQFQPISIHRPPLWRRHARWAKRKPIYAAASWIVVVALFTTLGLLVGGILEQRAEREVFRTRVAEAVERGDGREAKSVMDLAEAQQPGCLSSATRQRVDQLYEQVSKQELASTFEDTFSKFDRVCQQIESLSSQQGRPEQTVTARGDLLAYRLDKAEKARSFQEQASLERLTDSLLELSRRWARFSFGDLESRQLRSRVLHRRLRLARVIHDEEAQTYFLAQLRHADPNGEPPWGMSEEGKVRFRVSRPLPEGTRAYIARYEDLSEIDPEQGARQVFGELEGPLGPHEVVLRVHRNPQGDESFLKPGDLIVSLGGASVWRTVFLIEPLLSHPEVPVGAQLLAIDSEEVSGLEQVRGSLESLSTATLWFDIEGEEVEVEIEGVDSMVEKWGDARELVERGGVIAEYWDESGGGEDLIPAGILALPTACPAYLTENDEIDIEDEFVAQNGSYSLFLRHESWGEIRIPFVMGAGTTEEVQVDWDRDGPESFVFVSGGRSGDQEVSPFWIQDREVTHREYGEFLLDPRSLALIEQTQESSLIPRVEGYGLLFWTEIQGQYFCLPSMIDKPLSGVTVEDARAFARWKSEKTEGWEFDLPQEKQWVWAARGPLRRKYPFGNEFSASFLKSAFSKAVRTAETPLSYPVDESAFGVYDLSGSIAEWCLGEGGEGEGEGGEGEGGEGEGNTETFVRASSWGASLPSAFELDHRQPIDGGKSMISVGFRLTARRSSN